MTGPDDVEPVRLDDGRTILVGEAARKYRTALANRAALADCPVSEPRYSLAADAPVIGNALADYEADLTRPSETRFTLPPADVASHWFERLPDDRVNVTPSDRPVTTVYYADGDPRFAEANDGRGDVVRRPLAADDARRLLSPLPIAPPEPPPAGVRPDLAHLYDGTPEEVAERLAGLAQQVAANAPGWHAHGSNLYADGACEVCEDRADDGACTDPECCP